MGFFRNLTTGPGRIKNRVELSRRLNHPSLWLGRLHRATLGRCGRVVAVTGSFGKTTTTAAIRRALGMPIPESLSRNLNAFSFVPWSMMRQLGVTGGTAVVEVGIGGPGQMAWYGPCLRPDVAVVTGIGNEHHKSFGSLDTTADEKGQLVRALRRGGAAVLNRDDPRVMAMTDLVPGTPAPARVITFGYHESADVRCVDRKTRLPEGTRLTVAIRGRRYELETGVFGPHAAYAPLAALAVTLALGRDIPTTIADLSGFEPTRDRLKPLRLTVGAYALVDSYKSAQETIHAGLDALADTPARRRFVVLGDIDMPTRATVVYREVGAHAGRVADRVMLLGMHTKQAKLYRTGLRQSAFEDAHMREALNVHDAADQLRGELREGDVLLVKGRAVQKVSRLALLLAGRDVRCRLSNCPLKYVDCADCHLLEKEVAPA